MREVDGSRTRMRYILCIQQYMYVRPENRPKRIGGVRCQILNVILKNCLSGHRINCKARQKKYIYERSFAFPMYYITLAFRKGTDEQMNMERHRGRQGVTTRKQEYFAIRPSRCMGLKNEFDNNAPDIQQV